MKTEMSTINWVSLTRKILSGMLLLAGFLSAFGSGNLPPARTQIKAAGTPGVLVSITADKASFGATEQVTLHVTFTNPTGTSIGVLKWLTPIEGVTEPLFTVTRAGKPVTYVGILVKHAPPTQQDYITLAPGKSLSSDVNLADYYNLSASASYSVKFAVSSTKLYAQAGNQAGSLTSNTLNLFVEGRPARAPQAIPAQSVSGTNAFNSCDTSQQTDLINARNQASTYASIAKAYFTANWQGLRYTTWFGVFDPNRYGMVSSHFTAISNAVDPANQINFDCSCTKSFYAYVFPSSPYNIYLCRLFWSAPLTGTDSKAGTLIHEISHFYVVAGTKDHVYGQSGAKALASSDPTKAIENADSHEYFAENNPPQESTPTLTISGNAGVAGATLTYTGGSTTADASGNYSFAVVYGWSGIVTPSLAGYVFSPVSKSYAYVTSSLTAQNYTATATQAWFTDVPTNYWAWSAIKSLYSAGFTTGCSVNPFSYCPERSVTRAEMAIFIERGIHGVVYVPPKATGTVFTDVPRDYWAADWIEQLYKDGITGGCGTNIYCPERSVTRAEMAVFLLKAKYGSNHIPLGAIGFFTDVPTDYWDASWIEDLYFDGITGGCLHNPLSYCPERPVTRAEMAVFLVKTFRLP